MNSKDKPQQSYKTELTDILRLSNLNIDEAQGSSAEKYGQQFTQGLSGAGNWLKRNIAQPSYNAWGDFIAGATGTTPGADWTDDEAETGSGATKTPATPAAQKKPAEGAEGVSKSGKPIIFKGGQWVYK